VRCISRDQGEVATGCTKLLDSTGNVICQGGKFARAYQGDPFVQIKTIDDD
jgi:hypothetical protein